MDLPTSIDTGYFPEINLDNNIDPFGGLSPSGGSTFEPWLPDSSLWQTLGDDHVDTRSRSATKLTMGTATSGRVDAKNDQDWFKFSVTTRGTYTLRSSGDANVTGELFRPKGMTAVTTDDNGAGDGKNFLMTAELDPGTYYVRVMGRKAPVGSTYGLTVGQSSGPNPPPTPPPNPTPTPPNPGNHRFKITYNYDFDNDRFMEKSPEWQAALKEAAANWEKLIGDDFKGVQGGQSVTVVNPNTFMPTTYNLKENVDDLMIFVSADRAPFSGYDGAAALSMPHITDMDSDFEPDFGAIAFNRDLNLSHQLKVNVAMHEIGHVLGIIPDAQAFGSLLSSGGRGRVFRGKNAMAANGGKPVEMDESGAHVSMRYKDDLMAPVAMGATNVSAIDKGMLKDIGYKIIG